MNRQDFIETMQRVRPLIESGERTYICFAVSAVARPEHVWEIRTKIVDQLEPFESLEGWVSVANPRAYIELGGWRGVVGNSEFRELRLKWIDAMIAAGEVVPVPLPVTVDPEKAVTARLEEPTGVNPGEA